MESIYQLRNSIHYKSFKNNKVMSKKNKEDLITTEGKKDARSRALVYLEKAKLIEEKRLRNGGKYVKTNKGFKLIIPE